MPTLHNPGDDPLLRTLDPSFDATLDDTFDDAGDETLDGPAGGGDATLDDGGEAGPHDEGAAGADVANPVVARLLAEAARRRAAGEALPIDVRALTTSPSTESADRGPVESAAPTGRKAERPRDLGAETRLLRGVAKSLVDCGALSERRAVSFAMQARDAGVGFMRALAADRANIDLFAVYAHVGAAVGAEPIANRADAIARMVDAPWLPAAIAEQWQILPIQANGADAVAIAAVDPFDVVARDWARARAGAERIEVTPIHPDAYYDALGRYHALKESGGEADGMFTPISVTWTKEDLERRDLAHWDVPAAVDYVLHKGFEQGASDIHIEPSGEAVIVRNRVDGVLREELKLPHEARAMLASRIKVLANLDVAERRRPQDGRIGVSIQDHPVDVRVSTLPTVHGEKVVLRLLDEGALRPRLEDIGMPDRELRTLLDKVNAPHGLILMSGPTGSGKTTTLYSCLASIDRMGRNVVTIEDPVEYRLKGVHQTQVDEQMGFTFASGLRAILRQDPDVIMVGECRDAETTQMAIQASLTGHLVFSTIHANDAVGVVSRLLDIGVDPFLIANAVSMTLAQRLLRTHCPHCQAVVDGREVLANLRAEGVSLAKLDALGIDIAPDFPCVVTLGCPQCRHTGYLGRQAVFELLAFDDATRAAIMAPSFDLTAFRRLTRELGMHGMLEHALTLVEEGRTSYSEVVRILGES